MRLSFGSASGFSVCVLLLLTVGGPHLRASHSLDEVAAIDAKMMQIDRVATHELKKTLRTGTDGGGTLAAFSYEGKICHLKITLGMSNRTIETDYYYENDVLISASSRQSFFVWDKESEKLNPDKTGTCIEDRYYLLDGKIIQWITTRTVPSLSNKNSDVSRQNETILRQSTFFMQTARDDKNSVDVEAFIKQGTP